MESVNKLEGTSKAKDSTKAEIRLKEHKVINHASIEQQIFIKIVSTTTEPSTSGRTSTRRKGSINRIQENHSGSMSSQEPIWAATRRVLNTAYTIRGSHRRTQWRDALTTPQVCHLATTAQTAAKSGQSRKEMAHGPWQDCQ